MPAITTKTPKSLPSQLASTVANEVAERRASGPAFESSQWRLAATQFGPAAVHILEDTAAHPYVLQNIPPELQDTLRLTLVELVGLFNAHAQAHKTAEAKLAALGHSSVVYSPRTREVAKTGGLLVTRCRVLVNECTSNAHPNGKVARDGCGVGAQIRDSPVETERWLLSQLAVLLDPGHAEYLKQQGIPVDVIVLQHRAAHTELAASLKEPTAFTAAELRAQRDDHMLAMEVLAPRLLGTLYVTHGQALHDELAAMLPVQRRTKKKEEEKQDETGDNAETGTNEAETASNAAAGEVGDKNGKSAPAKDGAQPGAVAGANDAVSSTPSVKGTAPLATENAAGPNALGGTGTPVIGNGTPVNGVSNGMGSNGMVHA